MADLSTTYLGLQLPNPVIVGSSGLTRDAEGVRKCADAGAGGVVLKSIFEEQIREDYADMESAIGDGVYHPEAYEYFRADLATRYGARDYCTTVEACRGAVEIPVLASINCFSNSTWTGFARDIENAGASALVLNVSFPPLAMIGADPGEQLRDLAGAVREVTADISIPVAVKLPPLGLFVGAMAHEMVAAGAKGLILFNRFMIPDVDVEKGEVTSAVDLSEPGDTAMPRRYIALLSRRFACDLAASGGIHTAEDAAALLLVGAAAVQVVSAVYLNGFDRIGEIVDGLERWMDARGHATLDAVRGQLAVDVNEKDSPFGRFQYIRTLNEDAPRLEPPA